MTPLTAVLAEVWGLYTASPPLPRHLFVLYLLTAVIVTATPPGLWLGGVAA